MRSRIASTCAVVLAAALQVIAPSTAAVADAPNTCGSATVNRAQGQWLTDSISTSRDVDWFRFTTTAQRWTQVTVGALTADLALTLYDGSCHAIETSNHAGRLYEEIRRVLPAGRYFVRVTGVSGAVSPYQLRFRGVRSGDVVLSSHAWYDGGYWAIVGEILNNRSEQWFERYLVMTMYDRSGHVLSRQELGGIPAPWTRAHARTQFDGEWTRPKGFDHYGLTVVSERPQSPEPGQPCPTTLTAGTAYTDRFGQQDYPGHLRNDWSNQILMPQVMYTVYGSRGQVLYLNSAPVQPMTLLAHHTGSYDVVFHTVAGLNGVTRRVLAQCGPLYGG